MASRVSIIIPCHNAAPWLADTLESALAQTWPATEVIVVDDGSTDDSLAIARRFENRGIQVFPQANAGASAARNRGLAAARGDYLQFLDADDLLSPAKIERQLALAATRPARTVLSCAWGRFTSDPAQARFVDDTVFRDFKPVDFLVLAADTGAMMHPASWLTPRAVIERAGRWDETLSLNDDGEFFARVLLAGAGVAYCPDGAARTYYRSSLAGSLSQRRSERARQSQYHSIELITKNLLAAETSTRTLQATANYFQRFLHDYYPSPRDLMALASRQVAVNGGSTLGRPPLGAKAAILSRLVGWKAVRWLQHHLRS